MRIRLEVARSRSYYWPWFVRAARRSGLHHVERTNGLEVHVVNVADLEAALALWHIVRPWKGVSCFMDGRPVSPPRFTRLMWELEQRPRRTRAMLDGIIAKKAAERRDGPQY